MFKNKTQQLITASLLVALGLIFPYVTAHAFGIPGNILLPMHIFVLLIGLWCGPYYGVVCGLIIPLMSALLTGMPPFYPMLPIMLGELGTYGLMSGILLHQTKLGKHKLGVYLALVGAMVSGRLVYGLIFSLLFLMNPQIKALSAMAAFVTGLPGIILQLVIIPPLMRAISPLIQVRPIKLLLEEQEDLLGMAKELIKEGKASCVVIKEQQILEMRNGPGIQPVISLYEEKILENALVVDKIIGKAAAMVLTFGKVKAVYAETMSQAAKAYLEKHQIQVGYERCIDVINNREGNGICPMERAVMDLEDPGEALEVLKETLILLRKKRALMDRSYKNNVAN